MQLAFGGQGSQGPPFGFSVLLVELWLEGSLNSRSYVADKYCVGLLLLLAPPDRTAFVASQAMVPYFAAKQCNNNNMGCCMEQQNDAKPKKVSCMVSVPKFKYCTFKEVQKTMKGSGYDAKKPATHVVKICPVTLHAGTLPISSAASRIAVACRWTSPSSTLPPGSPHVLSLCLLFLLSRSTSVPLLCQTHAKPSVRVEVSHQKYRSFLAVLHSEIFQSMTATWEVTYTMNSPAPRFSTPLSRSIDLL